MKNLKQKIKIGIIQTPLTLVFDKNFSITQKLIHSLLRKKPDLIILPEMFLGAPSHPSERLFFSKNYQKAVQNITDTAKNFKTAFYFSYLKKEGSRYFNTAIFIDKTGKILSKYHKIHLFTFGNEQKVYSSGKKYATFDYLGHKMAGIICYDLRFPELSRVLAHLGSKILFVSAQWPSSRNAHWEALLKARAIENQMFVVGCNRLGRKEKLNFKGNSLVFNPWGECVLKMSALEQSKLVTINLKDVDTIRKQYPFFKERLGTLLWRLSA
ncbi:hypothetical protein K1X76_00550 [bacterium]|nr:hypothetical protein [bacterium]